MHMYKLVVLDIDGTLRDEISGIPQSAIHAITLCRAKHCQVIICTGRSMGTIQADVKALDVDGYICGCGCYILHHQKTLCDVSLPKQQIQKVRAYLKDANIAFAFESKDRVYMNQGAKEIFDEMNRTKGKQKNVNKQYIQETIRYEDNIHTFQDQPIHKLCLWTNEEVYQHVQSIMGDTITLAQQDSYGNLHYYEIIQNGYHKGNALKLLQKKLHIQKEETICFGDGDNDIEMFKASGCAIAMKHSHHRLKEHASAICEDVCEDGIYLELKRRNIL